MPTSLSHIPLLVGCGPFFSLEEFWPSILVLTVVKPLTYFAFIQAFRFRVSRQIPMSFLQAANLAATRSVVGGLVIGASALLLGRLALAGGETTYLAWAALGVERLLLWFVIGFFGADLRGRRLIGWTVSGTVIDAAYDISVGLGLFSGWRVHLFVMLAMAAFIVPLTIIGNRSSLRSRFSGHRCAGCEYDLTGNLSGICPECGREIEPETPARPS